MSFFKRLKQHGVDTAPRSPKQPKRTAAREVTRLNVDVYQTDTSIVMYAQTPGAAIADIQVAIEGNQDIVLIEGSRTRPETIAFPKEKPAGGFVTEECVWGDFYRKIILPTQVDSESADAKIKSGVLVLTLPLLVTDTSKHLKITKAEAVKNVS